MKQWSRREEVVFRPRRVGSCATASPSSASSWSPASAILTTHALSFAYADGPAVVRDVDLALTRGERVALVGTNGSGKSTLSRLLVGLLRPGGGRVQLAGLDPSRLAPVELARHAAYVFQDPEQQFVTLRVIDEVMLGLKADGRRDAEALMDRIDMPLGLFGDRSPYTLSGGEQRRLSLATALVRHPEVLVLDEPTYGQDRRGHEALVEILAGRVDAGAAVLAATHDERFIAAFANRVLRLEAGRIVANAIVADGIVADEAGPVETPGSRIRVADAGGGKAVP